MNSAAGDTAASRRFPDPPYYVAILSTRLTGKAHAEYADMEKTMLELAERQPGYLGRESITGQGHRSLTVVYYENAAAISAWHSHPDHRAAQQLGRDLWYDSYSVDIARIERSYRFSRHDRV